MKISNRCRYGLRAVVYLGINYEKEKVSLKKISEREKISKRYMEQIFSDLKKSGVVNSIKGTKGGYFLTNKPCNITVKDIIEIFEGDIGIIEDTQDYNIEDIEYTINNKVWSKMTEILIDVVDNITIEDLINDYNLLSRNMFYI